MLVFLRGYWRWIVLASGALLVAALWLYAGHLRQVAQTAKAKTQVAVHQAEVQVVATKAADAVTQTIIRTEERTRVITQTIHEAPGADTALPAAVRSAWLKGLEENEP